MVLRPGGTVLRVRLCILLGSLEVSSSLHALVAQAVVQPPLLWVTEQLVGRLQLQKLRLPSRPSLVGVQLPCALPVRALQLARSCATTDAKHCVRVARRERAAQQHGDEQQWCQQSHRHFSAGIVAESC